MSPSPEHEALHRIFQHDPALFTRSVSRILGIPVPEPSDVSVLNVDLTEIRPVERRGETAEWGRDPIRNGLPGLTCKTVTPLALAPDNVPAGTAGTQANPKVPIRGIAPAHLTS